MSTVYRSKNEIVYEHLHRAVLRGEYLPGERIVIDDVATKLGMSAIPIREALRQLEADGFVTIAPYVGATVTPISAESIFEVFALLETMEAVCARAACKVMSDKEIAALDDLVSQMDSYVDQPEKWVKLNKAFHLKICDYAHTALIRQMIVKVLDHWDRLRFHYMKDVLVVRLKKAQVEHRQIMQAFHERDLDTLEALMRAHNQNALAAYDRYMQENGHLNGGEGYW